MNYKLTKTTDILRSDGWFIPAEPANTMYQEYLAWLAEGNTPDPYVPPPPPIPSTVTRFQALAILAAGGYLDTVRTYINTLDQNNVQRVAWENAADWERTSPTLNALATMLNLTSAEVDDLFIAASQVSA
jgi:hypothetical protein